MILGHSKREIVRLAHENCVGPFDGVVHYNYETGVLSGCSMSQTTSENPLNTVIEVFRVMEGTSLDYGCEDCPFKRNSIQHENCCIETYVENDFDADFERNFEIKLKQEISNIPGVSAEVVDTIFEKGMK